MKKREKKAVFSKFKRTMVVSGAAAAILASSIVPAYAIEKDINEPVQEVVQEAEQVKSGVEPKGKEPVTKEVAIDFTKDMFSNTDTDRRAALEKQYKIQLDFSDVWADKKGQTSENPDGTVSKFTSHDEMKTMGFYAVNANRQELIKYGIRTGDWEPYNQYERDLLANQEAEKAAKTEKTTKTENTAAAKTDKVANVIKQTMKVASTTPIAAPTTPAVDFTSTEAGSNGTDAVNKAEIVKAVPSESVLNTLPPTEKELEALVGVDSNDDQKRRAALENEFGITLDPADKWEDKKGQTSVNPDGTVSEFTSHDEMKSLGFYAVNANRQELIQYGVRTDDWQPYYNLEFKREPFNYEVIDGNAIPNKTYYTSFVKSAESSLKTIEAELRQNEITQERYDELKPIYEASVKEYTEKAKNAPGAKIDGSSSSLFIESKYNNFNYDESVYWGIEYANWFNEANELLADNELLDQQRNALGVQLNFDKNIVDAENDLKAGIITKEYFEKLTNSGTTPTYYPVSMHMHGDAYKKVVEELFDAETATKILVKHGLVEVKNEAAKEEK